MSRKWLTIMTHNGQVHEERLYGQCPALLRVTSGNGKLPVGLEGSDAPKTLVA